MSDKNTVLLGLNDDGNKLYSNDYRHALLVAPAGSGKGVCFVIPNLLTFEESAIVHDIKLENYMLTSGYRASIGHKICVWNPLGEKTNRYNPLDSINPDPEKIVSDIQKIARLLIVNDEAYTTDAKDLFTSTVLYLHADSKKTKSFGEIARMLKGGLAQELSDDIDELKSSIHPSGYRGITAFLRRDALEQNAVIRVLQKHLEPWSNPLIDYATSKSDFDITDLKKHKMTLYIGVQPKDIMLLEPVLRFFYDHALDLLMNNCTSNEAHERASGVCLFMDEFYSIGRSSMIASAMPYFRGYKIKLFLIAANIQQIEKVYGASDAENIMSDCAFKIAFTTHNYDTANKISRMCIDRSKNKELLSWQQIMSLPKDTQILLQNHEQPIISKKFIYYEDKAMKKKVTDPVAF